MTINKVISVVYKTGPLVNTCLYLIINVFLDNLCHFFKEYLINVKKFIETLTDSVNHLNIFIFFAEVLIRILKIS